MNAVDRHKLHRSETQVFDLKDLGSPQPMLAEEIVKLDVVEYAAKQWMLVEKRRNGKVVFRQRHHGAEGLISVNHVTTRIVKLVGRTQFGEGVSVEFPITNTVRVYRPAS